LPIARKFDCSVRGMWVEFQLLDRWVYRVFCDKLSLVLG